MSMVWIPFDLTALPQEQQDSMYVAWLKLVAAQLKALSVKALIVIDKKGDPGPLTTNLQGAKAWINDCPQVLIAFNDFFANDAPNQSHPEIRRNDPTDYAKRLVASANEKRVAQIAGNLGDYEVLPKPTATEDDIEV